MPPIGPLLNALGLSGSVVATGVVVVVALAVASAGWKLRLKQRDKMLRTFYETGEVPQKRGLLRFWRKTPRTSLPGVQGPLPVPLTIDDLRTGKAFEPNTFVPTRVEEEFNRLVAQQKAALEKKNILLQKSKDEKADLSRRKDALDRESGPFEENTERAANLSKEASANEARLRSLETELRGLQTALAAIIKDDPRAQEFTEAWKKDIREELQGDETKFSVTEALKRARQRQQGGTRRPRRSQQKQDPKQGRGR